jgi:hypothetical protein
VRHRSFILVILLAGTVWFSSSAVGQDEDPGPPGAPLMVRMGPAARSQQARPPQIDPYDAGVALIFDLSDLPDCQSLSHAPPSIDHQGEKLAVRLELVPAAGCTDRADGKLRLDLTGLAGGDHEVTVQIAVRAADRLETLVAQQAASFTVATPGAGDPHATPQVALQVQMKGDSWTRVMEEISAAPGTPGRPGIVTLE